MKRVPSIGTILSAITCFLVVALAYGFTNSAIDAFNQERQAEHVLSTVKILRDIVSARDALRIELGVDDAAIAEPGAASDAVRRHLLALHSKSAIALSVLTNDLKAGDHNGTTSVIAIILERKARYDKLFPLELAAIQLPRKQRPSSSAFDPIAPIYALIDSIDSQGSNQSNSMPSIDPYITLMMKISDIAWHVRANAGDARLATALLMSGEQPPSNEQLQKTAIATGRIDALWELILEDANQPDFPASLHSMIWNTKQVYFERYRATLRGIIDQLAAGKPVRISRSDWLTITNPGLNSIMAISKTALDLTEVRASEHVRAATRSFSIAILLMLISIGVACSAALYVIWRIVRPLRLITRSINAVSEGNLECEISYTERRDEIGKFARALELLLSSSAEMQRLETELIRNQTAKEVAEKSNRLKS